MTATPTFEHFSALLAQSFLLESDRLGPASRLVEDLSFDSLRFLELWVAIEQVAGRDIDAGAVTALATLGEAYELFCQVLADRVVG